MSERNGRRLRERERPNLQHQAEHTHPRRSPLGGYLVILFAVAFLLLLMAYFQQRRLSDQTTNDALKQSASAVQSIQSLIDESAKLREENEALKEQVEELEKELWDAQSFSAEVQNQADGISRAVKAMDYFWQIDEAYVRQRYTLCKQLIQELRASGYEDALPTTKATNNDRFSPAERYKEIYDALY